LLGWPTHWDKRIKFKAAKIRERCGIALTTLKLTRDSMYRKRLNPSLWRLCEKMLFLNIKEKTNKYFDLMDRLVFKPHRIIENIALSTVYVFCLYVVRY
jgi:hypothetical protein